MQNMKAYIAGPLFNEGERWWVEELEKAVASIGFETFLPHRDNPPKTPETVQTIFENNRKGIEHADILIANLNGITTDDGTAWELGYAAALKKPSIGIFTDWRTRFGGDEVVNLMIGRSLENVVHSLDELVGVLTSWKKS
tara:strand:+ start:587 stop:1006 length:420 start_codon:yes stop_codon:yes gene_type:complete